MAPLAGEPGFRETRAPSWMYEAVFRLRDEPRTCRIHDLEPRFAPVLCPARESQGDERRRVPWLDRVTRRLLSCRIWHDALMTSSISIPSDAYVVHINVHATTMSVRNPEQKAD